MIELALAATLLSEHHPSHWTMTCSEWNDSRVEVMLDSNLSPDAKEYLIDYFRTKVEGNNCESYTIGRK